MALNVTSTKQALVDLVNAENKKAFTLKVITVGAPSDFVGTGTNSKARFTAIAGKGYRGYVDIEYNRLTTSDAFGITDYHYTLHGDVEVSGETVLAGVLAELSSKWSLPLSAEGEIGSWNYDKTGTIDDAVIGTLTIDLSPNYVLHGQLTVTVMNEKIPLPDVITIVRLDGFKEDQSELEDNG